MQHCSTPEQRIEWVINLLTRSSYGLISQYSREYQISRQTLYRWKQKAEQALKDTFHVQQQATAPSQEVEKEVLTLLVETHASYRQIQSYLQNTFGYSLSLGTICAIVQQAGERARAWMAKQSSPSARAVALDEPFSSQRGKPI